MTSTPGRVIGRLICCAATAALLSTGLSGCGLLDGSSRVEEALEYLPSGATRVEFVDRAAIAERLGTDDIETGASEKDIDRWAKKTIDEGYGTQLTQYVAVMQDAAFSDFDVEWEATGTIDDGIGRVWKLSDDVDLDEVADDLEDAGYERSGSGDAPRFHADLESADTGGLVGGRYPAFLLDLALVPDEHLVVSGPALDDVLDTVTDDKDSLSDDGAFDDLLDQAPDEDGLEAADLALPPACGGGKRLSPQQAEQQYEGLLHPDGGLALFAAPDEDVRAVRLFDSDDDARADAKGLPGFLDEQEAAVGFEVSGLDVEADGKAVLVDADFGDRRVMYQAWARGEGPFACPLGK